MAARVVEICRGIAQYVDTQQSNGSYGFSFNVLYANPAHHRLESTVATMFYVYPGPEGPSTATRNKWQHVYNATLHLVNYIDGPIPQQEIDDVFLLMERIIDSLKNTMISGRHILEFSTEDNPEQPYVDESLVQMNLAQSVRRAVYQEYR